MQGPLQALIARPGTRPAVRHRLPRADRRSTHDTRSDTAPRQRGIGVSDPPAAPEDAEKTSCGPNGSFELRSVRLRLEFREAPESDARRSFP